MNQKGWTDRPSDDACATMASSTRAADAAAGSCQPFNTCSDGLSCTSDLCTDATGSCELPDQQRAASSAGPATRMVSTGRATSARSATRPLDNDAWSPVSSSGTACDDNALLHRRRTPATARARAPACGDPLRRQRGAAPTTSATSRPTIAASRRTGTAASSAARATRTPRSTRATRVRSATRARASRAGPPGPA